MPHRKCGARLGCDRLAVQIRAIAVNESVFDGNETSRPICSGGLRGRFPSQSENAFGTKKNFYTMVCKAK
jgi:hypothetical protein